MPDAALRRVMEKVETTLNTISGVQFDLDRDGEEPTNQDEDAEEDIYPLGLIHVIDVTFQEGTIAGGTKHTVTGEIEIQSTEITDESTVGAIDTSNQNTIALINNKIKDDDTLGGWLEEFKLVGASGLSGSAPIVGACSLSYELSFHTPTDDWNTIVGHGGGTY